MSDMHCRYCQDKKTLPTQGGERVACFHCQDGTPDKPAITALAPWFGGKRTLASAIVRELGDHAQYVEPFCGSMAVLFAKRPSRQETVNDLHGQIINLARVIQGPEAGELYSRLSRVIVGDHLIEDLKQLRQPGAPDLPALDRAYWYFLEVWTGRNGIAGTCDHRGKGLSLAVRWTANGGSPTVRFNGAVDSIPAWHERLRNVVILRRDAFEIIPKIEDSPKTAIYIDPPYLAETRTGYDGSGGKSRYEHEFDHAAGLFGDDHTRLRDLLAAFIKARIVVSYYDHPRLRELYAGWTFVDHARHKHLSSANGRRGKSLAAEVLILNGPSYAAEEPQ
jgi:DNA adenine methylase